MIFVPPPAAADAILEACDAGLGVGPGGLGVYLDFSDSIKRLGAKAISIYRERSTGRMTRSEADRVVERIRPALRPGTYEVYAKATGFSPETPVVNCGSFRIV